MWRLGWKLTRFQRYPPWPSIRPHAAGLCFWRSTMRRETTGAICMWQSGLRFVQHWFASETNETSRSLVLRMLGDPWKSWNVEAVKCSMNDNGCITEFYGTQTKPVDTEHDHGDHRDLWSRFQIIEQTISKTSSNRVSLRMLTQNIWVGFGKSCWEW